MQTKPVKPWGSLSWPNRISMLRLLLVAPFVVLLMNQQRWAYARYAAVGIFVMTAVSDLIDGALARKLNAVTRLGAILDPLADKVLIVCSAVLLSLPGSWVPDAPLPGWVVVMIVGKDLWVIIGFLVVYLVTDRVRVHPTSAGKICTFGQVWLVGLTLIAPELNLLGMRIGTRIALVTGWIVAALCVLAVISYTRLGLHFVATEQKPLESANAHKPGGRARAESDDGSD
ncbi:MAG TPA: CDP-alcohol phosphatidyltransferase family protein [Phycisphaerae bacterium]|nr:CDP-alcohol phosphatidyltransferase family protein [Phycisphaerae bacterium]